ncbi:MAG TPA: hypothetical protein PKV27_11995, partial [Ilumatobacteraceae bacterium]|nr:hypothetical protein [Ilumatobacteraceae bacterium]
CANDSENRLAVLAEALKGPVEVRLLSDTDMLVVGERLVVRLTRGPGAVPQSVGPPTTTSVVAPTSDATSVPVGLDGWPQPSTQPASLAMVPRLLPSELVPGGVSVLRSTASVATEGAVPTIELFYDLARNARVNIVTTLGTPNFSTDEMNLVATDTWPTRWASAYTPRHITNGYSSLLLESRDGSVDLWAMNLSTAELTEIARTMTRLPDGRPGWNLHPSAHLTKFASGGTMPGTERHMVWVDDRHAPVAELSVGYETPDVLSTPWKPDSTVETIDVPAATRALVITNPGGRVSIAWSEGAVHGLFSIRGDRATAERIVRSLHEAGDDQWNAAATEYDATIEPCLGLFC